MNKGHKWRPRSAVYMMPDAIDDHQEVDLEFIRRIFGFTTVKHEAVVRCAHKGCGTILRREHRRSGLCEVHEREGRLMFQDDCFEKDGEKIVVVST